MNNTNPEMSASTWSNNVHIAFGMKGETAIILEIHMTSPSS